MKYDVITVGGGLAGSALARSLAAEGRRVLVLERETQFKDRVRGEQMACWGVADVKELGLYDLFRQAGAHEMLWWDITVGPMQVQHRNLPESTPFGVPNLNFYHPRVQEALIAAAAGAGAEVRRGARVRNVRPGTTPSITFEEDGRTDTVEARIVVGADGRNSAVRKWAGFDQVKDPDRLCITGVLMDDVQSEEDTGVLAINPVTTETSLLFPQGGGRARSYLVTHAGSGKRFQGDTDVPGYIAECKAFGVPAPVYESARTSGPLATFNGADSWVDHPYNAGVALIGDAAATSDPSWGQGLSLTVHDARLLRDCLLQSDDWDAAGHAYAEAHDRDFAVVHETEDWFTRLLYDTTPKGAERRMRVMPRLTEDRDYLPDTFQSGPEHVTLSAERRIEVFGE